MITQWEYNKALAMVATSERRYAELLSILKLLSQAKEEANAVAETRLWSRLKSTVESHDHEASLE